MPANLTPQFQKAEEQYRRAQTSQERIECLELMLKLIPKHKGTEKLQADIKTRLKDAKSELQADKKSPKKGRSYKIPRQGGGQVVLIGAPNAGKSRILAELTNAQPEVATYPFTTREPMPGMMPWNDVQVQMIDTPPITANHIEPYLTSMVRTADLAALCLDGSSDDAPDETADVLMQLESRKTVLSNQTGFDEEDFTTVHLKTLLVVTRSSDPGCDDRLAYFFEMVRTDFQSLKVDLENADDRATLCNAIYESLGVIRVYTKRPGKAAEMKEPFTIPRNGTVEELALQVHRDLASTLKFARIWGSNVHDGQSVGRDHQLSDRDLVELHS